MTDTVKKYFLNLIRITKKNQEMVSFCFLKHIIDNTCKHLSNLFSDVNNVKDNVFKK